MISLLGFVNAFFEILLMYVISECFYLPLEMNIRIICIYAIINYLVGRYKDKALLMYDEIRLILIADVAFFFISFLLLPLYDISANRVFMMLIITLIMIFFSLFCSRYSHILLRRFLKKRVLIIGVGKTADEINTTILSYRYTLMEVEGFVNCNNSNILKNVNQNIVLEGNNAYPLSKIERVIENLNIDTVLLAIPGEEDYYQSLISCISGLIGMWKNYRCSVSSFKEHLEQNEYCFNNWSFWLDVTILTKTVRHVLHGNDIIQDGVL